MTTRKTYTKEFKMEAVRLFESGELSVTAVARELGVRRNQLYKWQEQLKSQGDHAFSNRRGRPKKEHQSELITLRQENERLKEEVEILKKAAAYFARGSK